MRLKYILPILLFIQFNTFSQEKKPFYIGMSKQNIVYSNSIQSKYPAFKKNYFVLDDGQHYNMIDVLFYKDAEGFHLKNNLTSRRRDFADRTMDGKIDIYEYYVSTYTATGPYGGGYYSQRLVEAYDKGETYQLKKMKYRYLKDDLSDNDRSMAVMKDVKVIKSVSTGCYIAGIATMFYGLQLMSIEDNRGGTLFLLGGVFFIPPWIMSYSKKDKLRHAVRIYNE